MIKQDIIGKKFWRMTAIKFAYMKEGKRYFEFLCDCGNKRICYISTVTTGHTKSCGCLSRDNVIKRETTHGFTGTRFYIIYKGMRVRCNNSNNHGFKYYGKRGIKCLWNTFEEFKNDMFESYRLHIKEFGEQNTTIERTDNNKNYCKENCRWATLKEQANNKTNNVFYKFKGETHTLPEWATKTGLNIGMLRGRIYNYGWSIEKALTMPLR